MRCRFALLEKSFHIYGRVMDDRYASDYEIEVPVETQVAERDLAEARLFVERIERHLRQEGWLYLPAPKAA